MLYVILGVLQEVKPVWYYILAAVLFVLSQLDFFLLSRIICKVSRFSPFSIRSGTLHATPVPIIARWFHIVLFDRDRWSVFTRLVT